MSSQTKSNSLYKFITMLVIASFVWSMILPALTIRSSEVRAPFYRINLAAHFNHQAKAIKQLGP